jgi:shikimate dehydrogenase
MHNAAFKKLGISWSYLPFRVAGENLSVAMAAIRALNMVGVNITVPHKQAVLSHLDCISPEAAMIGAVNTVVNKEGLLWGYNTDGSGFIRSLAEDAGFSVSGRRVFILGSGGAARAVAVSLALAGAAEITITNRSVAKAFELTKFIMEKINCLSNFLESYDAGNKDARHVKKWEEAVSSSELVVQTTTIGMHPSIGAVPDFPYQFLGPEHLVVDLVYNPSCTEFLRRCSSRGAAIYSGLGMLLYQGVQALEMWTGLPAPVEVMRNVLKERCAADD